MNLNYIQTRGKIIDEGRLFQEIEADEESKFDSVIKGSRGYLGCLAIALHSCNKGALLHYSHFPCHMERVLTEYLDKIKTKEGLTAKISLSEGMFLNADKAILQEVFEKRKIPYQSLITPYKRRDILFFPEKNKILIFSSENNAPVVF